MTIFGWNIGENSLILGRIRYAQARPVVASVVNFPTLRITRSWYRNRDWRQRRPPECRFRM